MQPSIASADKPVFVMVRTTDQCILDQCISISFATESGLCGFLALARCTATPVMTRRVPPKAIASIGRVSRPLRLEVILDSTVLGFAAAAVSSDGLLCVGAGVGAGASEASGSSSSCSVMETWERGELQ
jgi:hypothetical protein